MPEIELKGKRVSYTVRKSQRSRSVRLVVNDDGLQITIPARGRGLPPIETILEEKADWILKHLHKIQALHAQHPKHQFVDGETLLFMGQELTIQVQPTRKKRVSVQRDYHYLLINLPETLGEPERIPMIRKGLVEWYRAEAKDYIPSRVQELAGVYGFVYERVTIKNLKSRWGSCSSMRNLNFNLRLMMMPPRVIDYIIIHELCHLKELNHSPRFWAWVERFDPEHRQSEQWIKANRLRLQF